MNSLSLQTVRVLGCHTGLKQALTRWSLEVEKWFANNGSNIVKAVSLHNWTMPQ